MSIDYVECSGQYISRVPKSRGHSPKAATAQFGAKGEWSNMLGASQNSVPAELGVHNTFKITPHPLTVQKIVRVVQIQDNPHSSFIDSVRDHSFRDVLVINSCPHLSFKTMTLT